MEFKKYITEMANAGSVDGMKIDIYTDHGEPHFHILKKNYFELRMSIKNQQIIDYKYQKDNKTITKKELKKIIKWLNIKSKKQPKITNIEVIKLAWDTMN